MSGGDDAREDALRQFHLPGPQQEQAFVELTASIRPILYSYLRTKGANREDREDIIEITFARIWEQRDRLTFSSIGQWHAFAKITVDRLLIDQVRSSRNANRVVLKSLDLVADPDSPRLVRQVEETLQIQRIVETADRVWLGPKSGLFHQQLLAAQMTYLEKMPWEQTISVLRASRPDISVRTEEEFLVFTNDVTVLRTLAFHALNYSNEDLTSSVLGCTLEQFKRVLSHIDSYSPSDVVVGDWTAEEVSIVIWKFYGQETSQQLMRKACEYMNEEQVFAILRRCTQLLPFNRNMMQLWRAFEHHTARSEAFSAQGFWKRLAFQYIPAGMPHSDFVEWFGPCAKTAGFDLTPGLIHIWISNRRLFTEIQEAHG